MTHRTLVVLRSAVPVRDVPRDEPRADFELICQLAGGEAASSSAPDPVWAKRIAGKNHTAAAALAAWSGRIQVSGDFPQETAADQGLPENVEINRTRISYDALRAPSAGASSPERRTLCGGVNGLLEGTAMGKAVIVTGSPGLADYAGPASVTKVPGADPAGLAGAMDGRWRARSPARRWAAPIAAVSCATRPWSNLRPRLQATRARPRLSPSC